MQELLFNYPGLDVRAGSVFDLLFDPLNLEDPWGKITGVQLGMIEYGLKMTKNLFHVHR